MRPKHKIYAPLDADLTFFASNVTGATFTLTTTATTDGLAHQLTIKNDTATDHSGKTAEIIGYDADNRLVTETLTMPAGSATVTSVGYYYKLVSVTPSATIGADTMDLGIANAAYSLPIPLNWRSPKTGIGVTVSGTINYTLQNTQSAIQDKDATINWKNHDDLSFVSATSGGNTNFSFTPIAMRVKFTSATAPGSIFLDVVPSDSGR